MQDSVIGLAGEMFRFVKKVQRLITEKRHLRMLGEKIVQRGSSGFLDSADDKINLVDFSPLKKTRQHRIQIERSITLSGLTM